jgi:hypothetical protein
MLHITIKDTNRDYSWHTGDGWPHINPNKKIAYIQADGHELTALYEMIPDLPRVNGRVVKFTQPWADLINANSFYLMNPQTDVVVGSEN